MDMSKSTFRFEFPGKFKRQFKAFADVCKTFSGPIKTSFGLLFFVQMPIGLLPRNMKTIVAFLALMALSFAYDQVNYFVKLAQLQCPFPII